MTDFIPPGHKKITDITDSALREKLASGEFKAVVWDAADLIPIPKEWWRDNRCQTWLDTGSFFDEVPGGRPRKLPILVKQTAPNAPEKRKGGAPTAADWGEIEKALEREIDAAGFPSKEHEKGWRGPADVVRWIEGRLGSDEEPSHTALKENVRRMLENIRKKKDGN
jgi:hypothetical protein